MPFSRKLMPPAFLVFTTISRVARAEVCAGAIRVSSATSLPSAERETQAVFSARICTVKVLGGFSAASGAAARVVAWITGGLASGWGRLAGSLFAETVEDAVGNSARRIWFADEADAGGVGGGVLAGAAVVAETVAGDGGAAGDGDSFSGREPEG